MADHLTPHRLGLIALTGCILGVIALFEQQTLKAHERVMTPIVINISTMVKPDRRSKMARLQFKVNPFET